MLIIHGGVKVSTGMKKYEKRAEECALYKTQLYKINAEDNLAYAA